MILQALLLILSLAIFPLLEEESGSYYVDASTGSDSNPGTSSAPWKTIQRAADSTEGGSVINIRAGAYNERVVVSRSGSAGAFITFQAKGKVAMQGFSIYADYIRIAGFEITNSNVTYADGAGVRVQGRFNEIRNNYIHDLLFGEGIWLCGGPNRDSSLTSDNTVTGNRILRARIAGILVEGSNNLISGNDISHTIQNPIGAPSRAGADADGIRFFGSGHIFRLNYIHDITLADVGNTNPHIDAFQTWGPSINVIIEQNRIWQAESPDQGITIEGLMQPVGHITIRNNIFVTNGTGYAPAVSAGAGGPVADVSIVNNTMIALKGGSEYAVWLSSNLRGAVVKNNAIYDHGNRNQPYIRTDPGASGLDIGFNSISKSDGEPPAGSAYPGDLWMVDPQFVDLAGRDFHLQPESPLINSGTPLPSVANDFDGEPRPFHTTHDIGAYEQ